MYALGLCMTYTVWRAGKWVFEANIFALQIVNLSFNHVGYRVLWANTIDYLMCYVISFSYYCPRDVTKVAALWEFGYWLANLYKQIVIKVELSVTDHCIMRIVDVFCLVHTL